jgi:ABC-type bacteriocin/lantibiotic exporter with double-glycine peptidase domain
MLNFKYLTLISIFLVAIFFIRGTKADAKPDYIHKRNSIYKLDDRYCGAYSAWHALRYFGIKKNINSIVNNVVSENGTTSIYELTEYLRSFGIKARPVKLDRAGLEHINKPFIPLLQSRNPTGHFMFCIPTRNGVVHNFDGPKRTSLDIEEIRNAMSDSWDGSCILLSKSSNSSYIFVSVIFLSLFIITCNFCIKTKGGQNKTGHQDRGLALVNN